MLGVMRYPGDAHTAKERRLFNFAPRIYSRLMMLGILVLKNYTVTEVFPLILNFS